uniref:30S ribosomal protein S7, chloroplastic n=1 Tax=Epipogium roseum TaxID=556037 RepID=A0A0B4N4W9_9ASPA|nr:ribosomal protein S7 [Epipogium roseum]AII40866.1 ribosomal protein S7 [Epipogium roseum]
MPRRGMIVEKNSRYDPIYKNKFVNMLVCNIMKNGKKSLAYKILYRVFLNIKEKTENNPLYVLRQAIRKVTPDITIRVIHTVGLNKRIPFEIGYIQGQKLAIRWILDASKKRTGKNMALLLSDELIDAAKSNGYAIRKKEEIKKMVEANRVYIRLINAE